MFPSCLPVVGQFMARHLPVGPGPGASPGFFFDPGGAGLRWPLSRREAIFPAKP